jgi:hypothetical protein
LLLDEHIGTSEQRLETTPVLPALEIEAETLLAAIEQREIHAVAAPPRPIGAHLLAGRALDS